MWSAFVCCQKYRSERLEKSRNQRNPGVEADDFDLSIFLIIALWEVIHREIVVWLS